MSNDTDNDIGAKLATPPKFNGEQEKFVLWWIQFKGYCVQGGYGDVLVEKRNDDLPDT